MLSCEIIAVGSELLTPSKTDTNSLWLTEKLNDIGVDVKLKTIVGDDEARLEEAVRDALKRADIVITTGGLGPTEDDVTRQTTARAAGRELVFVEGLLVGLRERFARWGREMPEINKRQAYIIEGAKILPNPNGSAAGMMADVDGRTLVVLPGPPRELKPMFEDHVLPELRRSAGDITVRRRLLKVTGMGESAVDEAIAPIYTAYKNVATSILFNRSEVEVHLSLASNDPASADATLQDIVDRISEKLGNSIFSLDGLSMEEVIGKLLTEKGKTVALAESCTGGLIGSRLTDVAGSSKYFLESAVTYSNEAKIRTLNVPRETIETFGAVSGECAEAMASGVRELAGSDYGVSVTGIAGPDGGSEEKPVGTVFIGISDENGTRSRKIVLPGDRYLIRWRASQAALEILRRRILDI